MTRDIANPTANAPQPNVRYRSQSGMKPFDHTRDASFLFPLGDARHDRIKLFVEARIRVPSGAYEEVLHSMASPDEDGLFAGRLRSGRDGPFLELFSHEHQRRTWLVTLAGRRNRAVYREQHGLIDVGLELDLNPTRYLAHQCQTSLAAIRARNPFEALRSNPRVQSDLRGRTLDASDNVLFGAELMGGRAFGQRDAHWRAVMNTYFDHVQEALGTTFAPAHFNARLMSFSMNVKQAEIYWELASVDAVSVVADLCNAFKTASGDTRVSQVFQSRPAMASSTINLGGDRNARWLKLPLTEEIDLKVYAKMLDRIRVELTYHGGIRRHAQRACGSHIATRCNSAVVETLLSLRGAASIRLTQAWDAIMALYRPFEGTGEICDFMCRLNSAVEEDNRRLMLSLLANHRGVTATDASGVASPAVCRALERKGVLQRIRPCNRAPARYALAPRYSEMFDRLAGRQEAPAGARGHSQ